MRTSFHHQPEAQHPIFQLSTSWQADYPIFRGEVDINDRLSISSAAIGPFGHMAPPFVAMRACEPCYIGSDHRTMGKRMRRWELIALLSGEAAALPLAAALTSMRS